MNTAAAAKTECQRCAMRPRMDGYVWCADCDMDSLGPTPLWKKLNRRPTAAEWMAALGVKEMGALKP